MELGFMLKTLFDSIYNIMVSFNFTVGGYTVNMFQCFAWCLMAGLTIRLVDWFRR